MLFSEGNKEFSFHISIDVIYTRFSVFFIGTSSIIKISSCIFSKFELITCDLQMTKVYDSEYEKNFMINLELGHLLKFYLDAENEMGEFSQKLNAR